VPVVLAVFVPLFFYTTNIGMFGDLVRRATAFNYKAFLIPMAIAFAVTGMSRAPTLVTDLTGGYFDRLCMTPVRRSALLLGMMAADILIITILCLPVLAIGFGFGVRFATGAPGILVFIAFSALWGWAFTGIPYAIALKTASPAAISASYGLFFPLFFLSDAVVPKQALAGWYQGIATYNPITYLVEALRSLILAGWRPWILAKGAIALGALGLMSLSVALLALRGRLRES
jgi:ABC-2 type transport system permease protein